ncbi:MAG: signal peptidase II [Nanoarchaeota archaeon]
MKFRDALLIVVAVLLVDQLSKFLFRNLLAENSISILGGFFRFALTYNTGAAFSIFTGNNFLLIILSVLIIAILFYYLKIYANEKFGYESFGLSLIIGGALGNLVDRIYLGSVVDFIDIWIWPVFNLADAAITIGVIIIIYKILVKESSV